MYLLRKGCVEAMVHSCRMKQYAQARARHNMFFLSVIN